MLDQPNNNSLLATVDRKRNTRESVRNSDERLIMRFKTKDFLAASDKTYSLAKNGRGPISASDKHFWLGVRHFGNTANNAFYNQAILSSLNGVSQAELVNWTNHYMSQPSWETSEAGSLQEFEFNATSTLLTTSAKDTSSASLSNSSKVEIYASAPISLSAIFFQVARKMYRSFLAYLLEDSEKTSWIRRLAKRSWESIAQTLMWNLYRIPRPAFQPSKPVPERTLEIFYGPPVCNPQMSMSNINSMLEHGTVRWINSGMPSDRHLRRKYKEAVHRADHLWVTNLDPETLEIASQIAHSKWSALPHPYVLSELEAGDSFPLRHKEEWSKGAPASNRSPNAEFVIFMPSSFNWAPVHNKGSLQAIEAFIELAKQNSGVVMLCINWGLQVEEAKDIFKRAGVQDRVIWSEPKPKKALQAVMKDSDIVWDQFGLAAFGALAIKAMEVGTPLLSRGLTARASALIGEAPNWLEADSPNEIINKTSQIFSETSTMGRQHVREKYGNPQTSWLYRRHHQEVTKALQLIRYRELLEDRHSPAREDAWAHIPDYGSEGWKQFAENLYQDKL